MLPNGPLINSPTRFARRGIILYKLRYYSINLIIWLFHSSLLQVLDHKSGNELLGSVSIPIDYLLNCPRLQFSDVAWNLDQAANPEAKIFISAKLYKVLWSKCNWKMHSHSYIWGHIEWPLSDSKFFRHSNLLDSKRWILNNSNMFYY